ncbi:ABC-type Fe3+-siderophore transport system, permease component [Sphaerochaeta pleomorpha str. Grapes]|uniref:ABC-type Fe3+-siderophore transport system, permease component n=1 Tax=Sphaerochaeta pleomorpha (strain ATCC BAA-1885 / DSM 22778 / Grapes) TaxID=158190 RepID=G8QR49_SPHPG|nr:iron ABC transporter permease [Sphaerochaeta pleomorpha]AEV30984.1 ABC-type Fe3+-siderophore transport system, permease component [Sphaerochaeta pleomorpha str. Grapes]
MHTLKTLSFDNTPFWGSTALLALLFLSSLCLGSTNISGNQLLEILFHQDQTSTAFRIVRFVRFPRTLAALLCGMALAVSGYLLQTALHNPLASVNIIGVNAGSLFATVLFSALFPHLVSYTLFASFLGALVSVLLVYFLTKTTKASRTTILLAGVALSSFFSACSDTVITLFPDTQMQRTDFLIGSFSFVTENQLRFCAWFILGSIAISLILQKNLHMLLLGDETAKSLGVPIERVRFASLFLSALLAGSVVSMCGLIGFIALIVPHLVRMLLGTKRSSMIPFCAICGAIMAIGCDILSRILFAPYEIPVGIVLSFVGSPFFLYLLFDRKRRSILA